MQRSSNPQPTTYKLQAASHTLQAAGVRLEAEDEREQRVEREVDPPRTPVHDARDSAGVTGEVEAKVEFVHVLEDAQ